MVLVCGSEKIRRQVLLTFCAALLCTACVHSPDINTPREIRSEVGLLPQTFDIAVDYDGGKQDMEVLDNLFRCEISDGPGGTVVSLRVELQNINPPAGNYINSLYFRAEALPADGSLHSLSGDPTSNAENAAKLLVVENGTLLPIVPLQTTGNQNNFLVSASRVQGRRRLQGWFLCNTIVPATGRTAVLTGQFTIDY